MKLVRTLRVGGDKGLTCVMRTSPGLENYLQENANPLVRVGEPLFDRLACGIYPTDGPPLPGNNPDGGARNPAGHPQGSCKSVEPDVVCKVLVDVTFVEILLYREPLTQR